MSCQQATTSEIDTAFRTLAGLRPGALLVSADLVLLSKHKQLVALAAQQALPAVWPWRATLGIITGPLEFW